LIFFQFSVLAFTKCFQKPFYSEWLKKISEKLEKIRIVSGDEAREKAFP
jgi:hypothetical protein